MPSVSPQQHRFMEMIAHDPAAARRAGVPQSVGREFAEADIGKHFAADGGPVTLASGGMAGFAHFQAPHVMAPPHVLLRGHPHASGPFNRPGFEIGGSPMGYPGPPLPPGGRGRMSAARMFIPAAWWRAPAPAAQIMCRSAWRQIYMSCPPMSFPDSGRQLAQWRGRRR